MSTYTVVVQRTIEATFQVEADTPKAALTQGRDRSLGMIVDEFEDAQQLDDVRVR
jgi:hypothetical protein